MKEERANIITAGLRNPTPDVSKAIAEAKAKGKHVYPILYIVFFFTTNYPRSTSHSLYSYDLPCIINFIIIYRC